MVLYNVYSIDTKFDEVSKRKHIEPSFLIQAIPISVTEKIAQEIFARET